MHKAMTTSFVSAAPVVRLHRGAPTSRPRRAPPRPRTRRARITRCTGDDAKAEAPAAPTGVLMVCLGNICRSPAAEAVMRTLASSASAGNDVVVDSCGTGGGSESWYFEGGFSHHEGDPSDARMRAAASERGIAIESVSRPLRPDDFDNFDYIVAMDEMNIEAIDDARRHWGVPDSDARVVLLSDYSGDETFRGRPVPDPYWSGAKGFELALDLIEESCKGLLEEILAERSGAGGEAQ